MDVSTSMIMTTMVFHYAYWIHRYLIFIKTGVIRFHLQILLLLLPRQQWLGLQLYTIQQINFQLDRLNSNSETILSMEELHHKLAPNSVYCQTQILDVANWREFS